MERFRLLRQVVEAKSEAEYKQWVAAFKAEQQTQLAATTTPSQ
jgi:heme/copper-type cytochrome/quinol oxidase subunit 2